MAEDKPSTPEQQLLKLIEGSDKGKGTPKAAAGKPKGRGFSLAGLPGALIGRLSFFRRDRKNRPGQGMSISVTEVNRLLYAAVACLFTYVVFDAVASATSLHRPPNFVPPKDMKTAFTKGSIEPLKETSYYLQKVSSRDIFKEGKKEEPVVQRPAENNVAEPSEAIKNLALVGISWSSNPDAIIEDKAHQRTFFVKRGQMVGEDVKVEAIFKDHVVVTNEDHEYELR